MKFVILIIFCTYMFINGKSQEVHINYLETKSSEYVFTKEIIKNGRTKVIDSITCRKENKYFIFEGNRIYFLPDSLSSPVIGEELLKDTINNFISNQLMADYEFTSYLYVIISKLGKIINSGIRSSRSEYNYEIRMLNFLNTIEDWIPATHNNKKVFCIRYLRFNVKLQ